MGIDHDRPWTYTGIINPAGPVCRHRSLPGFRCSVPPRAIRSLGRWPSGLHPYSPPPRPARAGLSAACRSRVAASTHRSSPFGPSCATFPVRRALPFLPFRASVPLEWTDCSRLLCPLLTSAPRSESLSALPAPRGARRRSPEVSLAAFHAQPPDLRSAFSMDMGFAVSCPLAQRSRLFIRFLFIGSRFRSALLSGPASRPAALALRYTLHLHQVGSGTLTPKLRDMLGTQRKKPREGIPPGAFDRHLGRWFYLTRL